MKLKRLLLDSQNVDLDYLDDWDLEGLDLDFDPNQEYDFPEEEEEGPNHIDPDRMYRTGRDDEVPFLYNEDGSIFYGDPGENHTEILNDYADFYVEKYFQDNPGDFNVPDFRDYSLEEVSLVGRAGYPHHRS